MSTRYRLAWLAYFLSGAGDWISRLAVPVLLFQLTGSALCLSVAYAITYLPFLVVTPAGGVFADAFDRRSLLVASDTAAGLLVVALALIASQRSGTPWLFYPVLFLIFSLTAVYHPIFQSYIPTLVPENDWDKANSYISASDNLTDVLGPVVGGLVVGFIGAANSLWLDAASFFMSASCIYLVDRKTLIFRPARVSTLKTLVSDFREGTIYVFRHRVLRYCCLLFALTNLGLTIFTSNFMFFCLEGLALTQSGLASPLVSPALARWQARWRRLP